MEKYFDNNHVRAFSPYESISVRLYICKICGAAVENREKHVIWHEWINKTI